MAQEELHWYQKSRVEWLRNGERNTTFFHLSAVVRQWKNKVAAIRNDVGDWIIDKDQIKEYMASYISSLFSDDGIAVSTDIPVDVFPELPPQSWASLSKPFSHLEIEEVVKNLGALRAPGPDGFQALFFQKNWELVKENVLKTVMLVLEGKGMPDHLNDTHIVLIPKTDHPELASQFRPIGLCNVVYKIITKTLVNRIKPILPSLISNTQGSFVPGRQITDNIVIVQEVIHTMKKKQGAKGFMALKIDFEKAYDRLKWSFIRDTLLQMNLPYLLIEVIMECISTARMQVLWNGEPSSSFNPSRGVRQGDPLSPYLFVMCMERLFQTIEESIIAQRWKPIRASRDGPLLSNLFFADDIILFTEASVEQAVVIQDCLDRFCRASGQKVSSSKSCVYFSKNVPDSAQKEISEKLGMEATSDLGLYLGMPTLTSRVTKATFNHLCEKIDRRLSGWKSKYLSLAGRITLANSTIASLGYYSMQPAKLPRAICDDMDRKVCRFIWGGDEDTRKVHLISWETLQRPKNHGDIGIKSTRQANSAFLTKLGWRMLKEPNTLWTRVLRAKYCNGRCDIYMFEPKAGSSNVWTGITENARVLCEGTQVAVGNGLTTRFWEHKWATTAPLISLVVQPLPAEFHEVTVAEMWEEGIGWKWDIFSPYLDSNTLKLIQAHEVHNDPNLGDLYYWGNNSKGQFTIKSAISIIRKDTNEFEDTLWNLVWRTPVQQRVRAFLWLVCHDRLLGNDKRYKRKMSDDSKCYICNAPVESVLHILRDCPAARSIWKKVGGPAELPFFFRQNLKQWMMANLNAEEDNANLNWTTYFSVTLWWIWRWRNCFVFNKSHEIPLDIGAFLQIRVEEYARSELNEAGNSSNIRMHSREIQVVWQPPPAGWYTMNSDGAAKGSPGNAGGGIIIRDYAGNIISAMMACFGACNAFRAEIMALLRGLELARNLQIPKLVVQMDNLACVKLMQQNDPSGGECIHLIKRCHELLRKEDWEVHIMHIYREGNRAADWLANQGVAQPHRIVILEDIPIALRRIVNEDVWGVAMPRLIPP